jgi:hypothetical protein
VPSNLFHFFSLNFIQLTVWLIYLAPDALIPLIQVHIAFALLNWITVTNMHIHIHIDFLIAAILSLVFFSNLDYRGSVIIFKQTAATISRIKLSLFLLIFFFILLCLRKVVIRSFLMIHSIIIVIL